jgi:hypothetical protein
MTVIYEWDCEEVTADEFEDVVDHWHDDAFAAVLAQSKTEPTEGSAYRVVLVRDDDDGRSWAYLDDAGRLPEYFEDASFRKTARVPNRFVKEVQQAGPK